MRRKRVDDDAARGEPTATPRMPGVPSARTPIVPRNSISGRALVAVVAIMTFLASLTTGAVMLVRSAASEWQSDVAREVTIQVQPAAGRDIEADVPRAAALARALSRHRRCAALYARRRSRKLLEPWLGSGLALDELPVPRLIVVRDRARRRARSRRVAARPCRTSAGRHARRSSRLDRPHARDGRHRGRRPASPS